MHPWRGLLGALCSGLVLASPAACGAITAALPLRLRIADTSLVAAGHRLVPIPPDTPLCVDASKEGGGRALRLPALGVTVEPGECTPPLWHRGELAAPMALIAHGAGLPDRDTTLYLLADPKEETHPTPKSAPPASHPDAEPAPNVVVPPAPSPSSAADRVIPVTRLPAPPSHPGQETIPILGTKRPLYRWPTGKATGSPWRYGVVPAWHEAGLVDLVHLDPDLRIDLRYATADNFLHRRIYPRPLALLRRKPAEALVQADRFLHRWGFGLCVWDAYRPLSVQRLMWRALPDRRYVADPARGGSNHNRAIAVDVTLVDLDGRPLPLPTPFDTFGPRAWHTTRRGLTRDQIFTRELLRTAMELHGFRPLRTEWWHYTYPLDKVATLDVPLD